MPLLITGIKICALFGGADEREKCFRSGEIQGKRRNKPRETVFKRFRLSFKLWHTSLSPAALRDGTNPALCRVE